MINYADQVRKFVELLDPIFPGATLYGLNVDWVGCMSYDMYISNYRDVTAYEQMYIKRYKVSKTRLEEFIKYAQEL